MANERAQPLRRTWEQCIRADPRMTGSTLLVLLVAASYGNLDGAGIRVGTQRLGEDTGMSERSVRYAIAAGVQAGYLHRERRGGRHGAIGQVSEYRLTLPFPVDNPIPTGNGLPVGNVPNRQNEASQPANDDTPTGNGLHTTSTYQLDQRPQPAAWCGRCDETRHITDEDTGTVRRCPSCHPLRDEVA